MGRTRKVVMVSIPQAGWTDNHFMAVWKRDSSESVEESTKGCSRPTK